MTGQETVGQAAKKMVADLAEQWGKFFIAKGIADMFTDPGAGAIELAEGTALLALGVALGAGGGFGSGSSSGNPNSGSGLIAGQTSSSGGGSNQTVSVTHLAEGGLVTGPTRALIGEKGAEAVIPLTNPDAMARLANALLSPSTLRAASPGMASSAAAASASGAAPGGFDEVSMAKFAEHIAAHLESSGAGAGGGGDHFHMPNLKGILSSDSLTKVMKQMSNAVKQNRATLHSSNSLRITRRSQ
jgi:hypothetical protein